MLVSETLDKAADLIEPEGAWTQFVFARDKDGKRVGARHESATCWCASGAIIRAGGGPDTWSAVRAWAALLSVIGNLIIPNWNDAPERTQAEVVAKLREAAAIARKEGR
jgi:hypothetical protein